MPNCRCTNDQITEPDPKRLMVNRTYIFNFRFTFLRRKNLSSLFLVYIVLSPVYMLTKLTEGCIVVFERDIITGFSVISFGKRKRILCRMLIGLCNYCYQIRLSYLNPNPKLTTLGIKKKKT